MDKKVSEKIEHYNEKEKKGKIKGKNMVGKKKIKAKIYIKK